MSHLEGLDLRAEVAQQVGLGDPIDHGEFTTCDVCSERIFGLRFTCLHCPCYNLCEKCENKGVDHETRHVLDILGLPPPPVTQASTSTTPAQPAKRTFSLLGLFRKRD